MYFITTKRMLEVCFSAHPNIQYRTFLINMHKNSPDKFTYHTKIRICSISCLQIIHNVI